MISCTPLLWCVRAVHEFLLRDAHSFGHFSKPDGETGLVEKLEHGVIALQSDTCGEGHVIGLMAEPFQVEAQAIPRAHHESFLLHLIEILKQIMSTFPRQVQRGTTLLIVRIPHPLLTVVYRRRPHRNMKRRILLHSKAVHPWRSGPDCRITSDKLTGFALALDGKVLHLAMFGRNGRGNEGPGRGSRLQRASARRRRNRYEEQEE